MNYLILAINPGSTSTKVALFENRKRFFFLNIRHPQEELSQFNKVIEQLDYRKDMILTEIIKAGVDINNINIVVGRGGLFKPIIGGIYRVNEAMIRDIHNPMAEHESNLGGLIAKEIANQITKATGNYVEAVIVDPTCVDELEDVARISGMPELPRKSFLHTLNQRAVARRYAADIGKKYEEINVIVAHMGGGISVGAHKNGRIIDTNNGLNGDGPMSPERSGGVPIGQLVDLCFSGKFSQSEIHKKIKGQGGLVAYLGTSNAIHIQKRIEEGDKYAETVFYAIPYQVAKEIGALSTVLKGNVDGILISGGLAYSEIVVNDIIERVKHLGTVKVFPGEDEMETLASNGLMVMKGEIEVKEYV